LPFWRKVSFAANFIIGIGILAQKFTNASRRALKLLPFWRKVSFAANFIIVTSCRYHHIGYRIFTNASRIALKLLPFWRKGSFATNSINGFGILAGILSAEARKTGSPAGNGSSQWSVPLGSHTVGTLVPYAGDWNATQGPE
jgi:hypothetical protein